MAQTKQEKQFLAAYDQYADALFRYCYFKTSDRELAKDLVSQTFLKAWGYLAQGQEILGFRPFLYKLANNLVIDWYRRKKSDSLDELAEKGLDPADNRITPEKHSEISWVMARLAKLKEEDRHLIVWRYVEDMSPGEIASIMGVEENIVSVRLHRAVARLRKLVAPN